MTLSIAHRRRHARRAGTVAALCAAFALPCIPSICFAAAQTTAPPSTSRVPGGFGAVLFAAVLFASVVLSLLIRRFYRSTSTDSRQKDVVAALAGVYALGLLSTPFLPLNGPADWVVLDFVALATSLGAAFFGFLFGLPHSVAPAAMPADGGAPVGGAGRRSRRAVAPSTNLETVADQLTKFITGAAFASIAVAAGYINHFGELVSRALTPPAPSGVLMGDMLLVAYGTLGFTISFIVTRTDLTASFQHADELLNEGSATFVFILPDVGEDDATDEQRVLAKMIVAVPFESLSSQDERITWARAQTIVGAREKAVAAFSVIYVGASQDPSVIVEYATALYNDTSFSKFEYIISLVADAARLLNGRADDQLRCRINALNAAVYLYVRKGYMATIRVVNEHLASGLAAPAKMRFYRACAFGQLYRAFREVGKLDEADVLAIRDRIIADTKITLSYDPSMLEDFKVVADPRPDRPDDDDLQAVAADSETYAKLLKLSQPPPQPKDREGKPVVTALPDGITTPGELARESPP